MLDIKGTDDKLKQVDGLLTTIKSLIRKHWGILLLIGVGACVYWIWNLPDEAIESQDQPPIEQVEGSPMYSQDSVDTVTYYNELDTTTVEEDTEQE